MLILSKKNFGPKILHICIVCLLFLNIGEVIGNALKCARAPDVINVYSL